MRYNFLLELVREKSFLLECHFNSACYLIKNKIQHGHWQKPPLNQPVLQPAVVLSSSSFHSIRGNTLSLVVLKGKA
jgi:hypothetical protein